MNVTDEIWIHDERSLAQLCVIERVIHNLRQGPLFLGGSPGGFCTRRFSRCDSAPRCSNTWSEQEKYK